jgi:biotin carboxyl carrier protein
MKYSVTIKNKSYVVEIEDINARPVIAHVEGQRFEVIPDTNPVGSESKPEVRKEATEIKSFDFRNNGSNKNINEMTAPLPGVVIELFVKAGNVIEAGQVIVIIEAMKMKNSIRSTRAGKISEVLISVNQTVAHKQILVKFE